MKARSRTIAVAALASLIATSSVIATAAAVVPESANWLTDIAESDQLDGPILARGSLIDTNGRPVSGQVSVVAWPRPEVMATLDVGDTVKTAPVAKATVGADGRFALRVDPAASLKEFMLPDGTVNFDLWAETADGWSLFSFPRALYPGVVPAWVDPQALGSTAEPAPQILEVTLRSQARTVDSHEPATAPAPASDKACVDTVVATYNGRVGIVGEVYPGPHATADFQYINGSSSTLGVGFDAAGGPVTFTASGTTAMSSTGTIDYPTQAANKRTVFQSTFGYQNVQKQIFGSAGCIQQGNQVRPYRWDGGALSYAAASTPSAPNCSPVSAVPATLTKDTANAITFSNGLEISGVIGIDLSLKTGFNTSTKIKHVFSSVGQLCGSDASWPSASRVVGK